jgi:MFS family permease
LNLRVLTKGFTVSRRKIVASALLISGALAWFFLINQYIVNIFMGMTPNEPLSNNYFNLGQGLFYGFAIISAIIGSLIRKTTGRRKLLLTWILLGIFSTILLTLSQGLIFLIISSTLLGISFGWGLPISLAFLADCTAVEERARLSGIVILATFIFTFIISAVIRTLSLGLLDAIYLFAFVRLTSILALIVGNCDARDHKQIAIPNLPKGIYKEFLLYFFPFILFCVAAGLAFNLIPATPEYESAVSLGKTLRSIFIAVSGLTSGVVADRIGRKQPIIIGLIMLGVSFALLGFSMSWTSVVIYFTTSGIAWGLFLVIFLAIPGDLSVSGSREKFYAIGFILPFSILLGLSAIPGWAIFSNSGSSISQLFSLFLFLSIIPILLAKETLPAEKVRDRKMKEHLENIGKLINENRD